MLDIKLIRENPELVKENIRKKFQDQKLVLVDEVIAFDEEYRSIRKKADDLRAKRNSDSKQIGLLLKEGKKEEAAAVKAAVGTIGQEIADIDKREVELEEVPTVEMLLEDDVPEDDDDSFANVTDIANEEETETEDSFADVTDFATPEVESIDEEEGFADVTDFEEPVTPVDDDSFADVTDFANEDTTEIIEEPAEPVIEETQVTTEEDVEPAFDEVDELNNDLSSSNIDYLTTKEDVGNDNDGLNGELKKEIKSVLLYMDQLLENLPEEKIYEFAKSEEFATYKKLFKDLGLS